MEEAAIAAGWVNDCNEGTNGANAAPGNVNPPKPGISAPSNPDMDNKQDINEVPPPSLQEASAMFGLPHTFDADAPLKVVVRSGPSRYQINMPDDYVVTFIADSTGINASRIYDITVNQRKYFKIYV